MSEISSDQDRAATLVEIDNLLGPAPDWQDAAALAARQDYLVAVAHAAGETAITALAHAAGWHQRGLPFDRQAPVVEAFSDDMARLDRAMRDYTRQTDRDDVLDVVERAVEFSAGNVVAAIVMGVLDGVRSMPFPEITA